ncbi:MAG: chloride channel protein, partial [Schleiferiaceae bacterium]|nr:chloride channel protein [Schleiferiaceae bacterium]MDP4833849.1 chloride channel protein [Schleiferiaceae bacterium]
MIQAREAIERLLRRFLIWRAQNLDTSTFLVLVAVVTGLISGLVAVVLKNAAHAVRELVVAERLSDIYQVAYFLFPLVGISIVMVLRRSLKWRMREGIPMALSSIAKDGGIIPRSAMYTSFVGSAFTVGFGGSVGLEGPTVGTGAAIGSNLARWLRLGFKQRILLISCATAGALGSIFGTPIAALVFTLEVFSLDLTLGALVPLLLASATGSLTGLLLSDGTTLFTVNGIGEFEPHFIPQYLGLGVVTALFSVYVKRAHLWSSSLLENVKRPWFRAISGGLLLGGTIFLIPPLYGEGFGSITAALQGDVAALLDQSFVPWQNHSPWIVIALLLGLALMKSIAAGLTIHAGGVGGMFAPTLFMGAILGLAYVLMLSHLGMDVPSVHFVLVAMAGLMAGVMHAPLTGMFMITEISGGYPLILPLMLVSAVSFFVSRSISPHSIYTAPLAAAGGLWTTDRDKAVLNLIQWDDVLERGIADVAPHLSFDEAVQRLMAEQKNMLAVVEDGRLLGTLTWDDVRRAQRLSLPPSAVRDAMSGVAYQVDLNSSMEDTVKRVERMDQWYVPVIDNGHWVG